MTQNSGNHVLMFTTLLKSILKVTDKQPGEEIHSARSGRVLCTGVSVPMKLGCIALLILGCLQIPGSSPNLLLLGFSRRVPKIGMIDY